MGALLSPLPPDDFRKRWSVTGHPNLRVDAEYDEEFHRNARLRGYSVIDTRHHAMDRRHIVCFRSQLAEIREWVRENAETVDPTPGCPEHGLTCEPDDHFEPPTVDGLVI